MLYPIELWAGKPLRYCLAFTLLVVVAAAQLPPGPLLVLVEVRVDVEALVGRIVCVVLEAHAIFLLLVKQSKGDR